MNIFEKGKLLSIKKILPLLLLGSSLLFSRNMIGLNINTEDIEVEAAMDIANFVEYTNGTMFIADANFISTEDDSLFGIGLSAHNSFQGQIMEGLSLGLGIRFVHLEDFSAIPLMAEASYAAILTESLPAASFSLAFLYAPSVLSFDEGENYFEFRAEAGMEVISAVSLYVGYRNIDVEYTGYSSETFNSSLYGGLKMSF